MGQDKALVTIGSVRMIDHMINRVSTSSGQLFISGSDDYGTGLPLIQDRENGPGGPSAALYAASQYFSGKECISGFFTVPVDVPDFPQNLFDRLLRENESRVAADEMRLHPTLGWWRIDDLVHFFSKQNFENSLSMHSLAKDIQAGSAVWREAELFNNLNSPNDIADYHRNPTGKGSL